MAKLDANELLTKFGVDYCQMLVSKYKIGEVTDEWLNNHGLEIKTVEELSILLASDVVKVYNIMSKVTVGAGLHTVKADDTIYNASTMMSKHKVSSLITIKDNKSVGIITERDIVQKIIGKDKDPRKTPVSEIMSSPLLTLEYDAKLEDAANLMIKKQVKKLVVTNDKKIIGILSTTDFMRTYGYILKKAKEKARTTGEADIKTRWD